MDRTLQRQILAYTGKDSLWWFLMYAFGIRDYCKANPQDNWIRGSVHRLMADWLEGHIKDWETTRNKGIREPKKLLIEIFRGGGKSTIGCGTDLWIQTRNPETAEAISSYDIDKSKEFLAVNKTVMEGVNGYGNFRELYGTWSPIGDERIWQKDKVVTSLRANPGLRDYSMAATSIGRGLTGARPDVFRLDDPIVREKLSKEPTWVIKAREHLDSIKFAVKTNGLYIVFLTPYLELDVAGKILREEGCASLTCPGKQMKPERYKMGGPWHVFHLPIRDENGHSVLPNVYPDELLTQMEKDDPDDFAAQMMCDPAGGSHMPLNAKDVESLWVQEQFIPPNLAISIHLDTAFKDSAKRERGDFNVIQVWGHDRASGKVYYLDGFRDNKSTAAEFMRKLIIMLQDLDKRNMWPFVLTDEKEPGGKQGMFEEFLVGECHKVGIPSPNYLGLSRGGTRKEQRILNSVYAWKSGKVGLMVGAPHSQELVYEMLHIGYSAKDDMADTQADVFHPEVYLPDPGLSEPPSTPSERPYDQALWARPGDLGNADYRTFYDDVRDEFGNPIDDDGNALVQ